ncbi:MAG TPA: lipid-A-disaccharide synthase-related protein [Meiothermus sp.]|nr:lipid-A-disaccharide synthase-related protein [Meiothermus sp.]
MNVVSDVRRLIIISNGHGEDAIGAAIARELRSLGLEPLPLPLVGKGNVYQRAGFPVLGPRQEMPSGGFVRFNLNALMADLRSGWLAMTQEQVRALRAASQKAATLVVGDLYGLFLGSRYGARPLFQVQPLVSVRYQGAKGLEAIEHLPAQRFLIPERLLMRRAERVYPRDLESTAWLQARGIRQAVYLGNPMLDAAEGEAPLELPEPYLLLLPGSRADAYFSLPIMLEAARGLRSLPLTPVVAWSGLALGNLQAPGWRLEMLSTGQSLEPTGQEVGVTHTLTHPDGTRVFLTQGAFKSALLGSKLAFSTSGSAAEQAAGYGVPLIGFPTLGPQYTPSFARAQGRLLGKALTLTSPRAADVAQAARVLLSHPEAYRAAQEEGKRVMGAPGAARRIAEDIAAHLKNPPADK